MKTMNIRMISLFALGTLAGSIAAQAHEVGNAKVVELTLHRIERLVILKKMEDSFQTKLKSLKLEALPHQNEEDPSFKVTANQYAGGDGSQKSVEIILNQEGKALSFAAKPGADAVGAPDFAGTEAITLAENSLHWVEDAATSRPEIASFSQGLTELNITSGTNQAGAPVAVVDLLAGSAKSLLRIRIKLDGSFDSAEVLPKTE
jgi:hypothetical protein